MIKVGFKACLRSQSASITEMIVLMLKVKYYLYTNIVCSGSQSEVPKTFS